MLNSSDSALEQGNEVMTVLSLLAAIFLLLALVVGICGMNFTNMPELQWQYGYFVILAMMTTIAASLVIYFKKKQWF